MNTGHSQRRGENNFKSQSKTIHSGGLSKRVDNWAKCIAKLVDA